MKFGKSMPGADADSDHIPVIRKIRMKLKKLIKKKQNPKSRKDKELRKLYHVKAKNKHETLEHLYSFENNPDAMWNQFQAIIS